jgi:hypothetical protein
MDKKKTRLKKDESEWDRKKIVFFTILIIILLIFGFSFKNSILGTTSNKLSISPKINAPKIDIKKNVQDQIQTLKDEATNINVVDIATSSPQVQKVINDLKALKDYPNNQLKKSCINLCSKL